MALCIVVAALLCAAVLLARTLPKAKLRPEEDGMGPARNGLTAMKALVAFAIAVVSVPIGCAVILEPYVRSDRYLPDVAAHGERIVTAIRAYHQENGAWPSNLGVVMARYGIRADATGFPGSAEWTYKCTQDSWSLCLPINGPSMLDFNEFSYSPSDEPSDGYGYIVRCGDWLYLDD